MNHLQMIHRKFCLIFSEKKKQNVVTGTLKIKGNAIC